MLTWQGGWFPVSLYQPKVGGEDWDCLNQNCLLYLPCLASPSLLTESPRVIFPVSGGLGWPSYPDPLALPMSQSTHHFAVSLTTCSFRAPSLSLPSLGFHNSPESFLLPFL